MMNRGMLLAIVLAVAAWGAYHAVGAYLFNHNPWRAAVVAACVAAFLAFWGLLLWRGAAKSRRNAGDDHTRRGKH
jgi:threonine/homoserine/homoserine lactone efflux protein